MATVGSIVGSKLIFFANLLNQIKDKIDRFRPLADQRYYLVPICNPILGNLRKVAHSLAFEHPHICILIYANHSNQI